MRVSLANKLMVLLRMSSAFLIDRCLGSWCLTFLCAGRPQGHNPMLARGTGCQLCCRSCQAARSSQLHGTRMYGLATWVVMHASNDSTLSKQKLHSRDCRCVQDSKGMITAPTTAFAFADNHSDVRPGNAFAGKYGFTLTKDKHSKHWLWHR